MKTPEEIFNHLRQSFTEYIVTFQEEGKVVPWITISAGHIHEVAKFLRDDPQLLFDTLMCLSGVHYENEELLGVTYHIHSTKYGHSLTLKVECPIDNPRVQSVEQVWKTANWHEREAWDMLGIKFDDHPDLSRILCPDDWEGHPLRKDYQAPQFYHDIKISD